MANIYEQVKQAIQDVVAPDLAIISGNIKALSSEVKKGAEILSTEIKRLDEKIDSKHNEAVGLFQRLDEKIDSLKLRLSNLEPKIEQIDEIIVFMDMKDSIRSAIGK